MTFDYGNKLSDGQHEHHPINKDGEYAAPIRRKYIHKSCGVVTKIGLDIAETYAKNPNYYGRTFCCGCKDYFNVGDFYWEIDGVILGQLGGEPGKTMER